MSTYKARALAEVQALYDEAMRNYRKHGSTYDEGMTDALDAALAVLEDLPGDDDAPPETLTERVVRAREAARRDRT